MKKNKMMRLASALLVLTLLTTGIIGGTLAKYVTSDSGTDTARVAKFGVVATVSGDLFGSTYAKKDEGNTIVSYSTSNVTVKANATSSSDAVDVVAPGTENKKGLTLSVTGTPEVSTQVTLGKAKNDDGVEFADSDIYLMPGEYGVMVKYEGVVTQENMGKYFTESSDTYTKVTSIPTASVYELRDVATVGVNDIYYPLTWYVDGAAVTIESNKTAHDAVTTALKNKFTDDKTFQPNQSNNLSATVGWEWKFEDDDDAKKAARDAKDTILGDMISAALTTSDPIVVVKKSGDNYVKVEYTDITSGASEIKVAYTGLKPDELISSDICACLTTAYSASITVTQVD